MKISVGPLLLLSLVAFFSVTLAKSVFTFNDVLAAATADFNQKSQETKAFAPPKKGALRSMVLYVCFLFLLPVALQINVSIATNV